VPALAGGGVAESDAAGAPVAAVAGVSVGLAVGEEGAQAASMLNPVNKIARNVSLIFKRFSYSVLPNATTLCGLDLLIQVRGVV